MIYAPVLIPTVNRFLHFKECLESLSRCTWADKTDVYVAVDYPGKEAHWEGYRKIREYLNHCGDLGFHSLNVTYREENYFYSGKGNLGTLLKEVLKTYDRYILTEDDNVFSPNFLVYINKGLEKFKDDPSVLAIVGYRHFYPVKYGNNTFFRQNVDFSAWGYGIWKDRMDAIAKFKGNHGFYNTFSISKALKLLKNGRYRFCMYLNLARKKKVMSMHDNPLSVYMAVNDMDILMPTVSLVRNQGWDSSGIHCSPKDSLLAQRHMTQEISVDENFEFVGTGFEYYEENKKIYVESSYTKMAIGRVIKSIITFGIYRLFSLK